MKALPEDGDQVPAPTGLALYLFQPGAWVNLKISKTSSCLSRRDSPW